jgi:CheY-like chemotaxis protein
VILVAHESESIREVIRLVIDQAGWGVRTVGDGRAALDALEPPPAALVLDVAVGAVHAYRVVEEVRRCASSTRIVLVASVYNRTGYKRRPTSLYGADDYVEQHHIPDALIDKLTRLIGPPPLPSVAVDPHAETPEGRRIREAGVARLSPSEGPSATRNPVERAERLARLIVTDIALYNGDALDQADALGDVSELEARLRHDLDEGRLLFDLRVPEGLRRTRDFISEALDEIRVQRRQRRGA